MTRSLFLLFALAVWLVQETYAEQDRSELGIGVVWSGTDQSIQLSRLAQLCAPVLWPSPDEPLLQEKMRIPRAPDFLRSDHGDGRVAYYQINRAESYEAAHRSWLSPIWSVLRGRQPLPRKYFKEIPDSSLYRDMQDKDQVPLDDIHRLYLMYFFYYGDEKGVGQHGNDTEAIQVLIEIDDVQQRKFIRIAKVIAHAHGSALFDNRLRVTEYTKLPIHILVEEGKHASCTDRNADGIYTPGYDVNIDATDAWGVRDIIRSGRVPASSFRAEMAKPRRAEDRICPDVDVAIYPANLRSNYQQWCGTGNPRYDLVLAPRDWRKRLKEWPHGKATTQEKEDKKEVAAKLSEKEFGNPGASWFPHGIGTWPWNLRADSQSLGLAAKTTVFFRIPVPKDLIKYDGKFHIQFNLMIEGAKKAITDFVRPVSIRSDLLLVYTPSLGRAIDWFFAVGPALELKDEDRENYRASVNPAAEGGIRLRVAPATTRRFFNFVGFRVGGRVNFGLTKIRNQDIFVEFGFGSI